MWAFACACVCARLCVPSALCALIVLECNWCAQSLIALMKTTCECHYFSSCVCSLSLSLSLSVCLSLDRSVYRCTPTTSLCIGLYKHIYKERSSRMWGIRCTQMLGCSGTCAVRCMQDWCCHVDICCGPRMRPYIYIYISPFLSSLAPGLLFGVRSMRWSLQGLCS